MDILEFQNSEFEKMCWKLYKFFTFVLNYCICNGCWFVRPLKCTTTLFLGIPIKLGDIPITMPVFCSEKPKLEKKKNFFNTFSDIVKIMVTGGQSYPQKNNGSVLDIFWYTLRNICATLAVCSFSSKNIIYIIYINYIMYY